jgi:hypothetical protein
VEAPRRSPERTRRQPILFNAEDRVQRPLSSLNYLDVKVLEKHDRNARDRHAEQLGVVSGSRISGSDCRRD